MPCSRHAQATAAVWALCTPPQVTCTFEAHPDCMHLTHMLTVPQLPTGEEGQ